MEGPIAFMNELSDLHADEVKNVIGLVGNVQDRYPVPGLNAFVPMDQVLGHHLKSFTLLRFDIATGLSAMSPNDEAELLKVAELANVSAFEDQKLPTGDDLRALLAKTRNRPVEALIHLRRIFDGYARVVANKANKIKPLCVVVHYAGALFPAGDFDRLSETNSQRLVEFLSLITSPGFTGGDNLVVLVSTTRSEVNSRIFQCPTAASITIDLPNDAERSAFIEHFVAKAPKPVSFGMPKEQFTSLTAGLRLVNLADCLEAAARTGVPITRKGVMERVNAAIKDLLGGENGDIVEIKRPEHGPDDVIGYASLKRRIARVFERFSDRKTAFSVALASGANGVGKTYVWEAYAGASGYVVLVIKGVRSMWYGQTDRLIEQFRFVVKTFGKCIIFMDEAHTQFSSIHDKQTQDVEKRLNAAFITMMSDKTLLGQLGWVLMTTRPDLLDPDIKSRAGVQLPIFDTEGEDRREFVKGLFERESLEMPDDELTKLIELTQHYSARDFSNLIQEARAAGTSPVATLDDWQAAASITEERECQALIASRHCSYRDLLPAKFREMKPEELAKAAEAARYALGW